MPPIETNEKYQLSWLDDEKTLLHFEVYPGWTWDDAAHAMPAINQALATVEHDAYTLFHFHPGGSELPRKHTLSNMKWILSKEMPNEKLIILINAQSFLGVTLNILTEVYKHLSINANKVRHAANLDEALQIVAADKQEQG
jgi:hypothetical protein